MLLRNSGGTMSRSRTTNNGSSRRTFLKAAAGLTAGTALGSRLWAQGRAAAAPAAAGAASTFSGIHRPFLITPRQALDWHLFKSQCGPTYAGSAGWKRFTDFLIAKLPECGAV